MIYQITWFRLMVPFCACPIEGQASGTIDTTGNKVKLEIAISDIHYNYQVWQALVARAMIPARHPSAKTFAISTIQRVLNEAPFRVESITGNQMLVTPDPDDNLSRLYLTVREEA